MNRRTFFTNLLLSGIAMNIQAKNIKTKKSNKKMPVIFLGHGSPMNAINTNSFTEVLNQLPKNFSKPKAIVIVSAHWVTEGTLVTGMDHPKTIHDFYGFPDALFKVEYKAPGNPKIANEIIQKITPPKIQNDMSWGLDHGTWSVLKHMYPKANIPIIQLSIDKNISMNDYYEIGKKLNFLREEGVLLMGSGNLVHNLRELEWKDEAPTYAWADEFDQWIKKNLDNKNHNAFINDIFKHPLLKKAHPSLEHYIPLLFMLGATTPDDKLEYIYEGFQNASISMRSIIWS